MSKSTINVIETVDGAIISNRLFTDKTQEAEALFIKCINEHEQSPITTEEAEAYMDDGIYDDSCGYCVMLSHPEVMP